MIEPTFRTLLVATVGRAVLVAPGFRAASRAAVALSAIAVRANPERRPASQPATNSRPEDHFSMHRHRPTHRRTFDNGNGSCHGRNSFEWWPSYEGCQARTPLLPTAGFFTASQSPYNFLLQCFGADRKRTAVPSARARCRGFSKPCGATL